MERHSPAHNTLNRDYLAKLDLFRKAYEYNSPTRKKHTTFFYEMEENINELKNHFLSEFKVKEHHKLLAFVLLILLKQEPDFELFK